MTSAMKDRGSGGNPQQQEECDGPAYYVLHKLKQYSHFKGFFFKG